MEKILHEGEKIMKDCENTWDYLLDQELGGCERLNVLVDRMQSVKEVLQAVRNEMKKIKSELSN
jgi:hypothetical protein